MSTGILMGYYGEQFIMHTQGGGGSLVVSHYGAVRLFASWHNGVLCGHSKMCRQQAGAAVGVEPPQAAERPGASYHKDAA